MRSKVEQTKWIVNSCVDYIQKKSADWGHQGTLVILENQWGTVRLTSAMTLKRPNCLKREIQISYDKRIDD